VEREVCAGAGRAEFRREGGDRGKNARTLATEILAMSEDKFRVAFKGSATKGAKLTGLRRNATVLYDIETPQ